MSRITRKPCSYLRSFRGNHLICWFGKLWIEEYRNYWSYSRMLCSSIYWGRPVFTFKSNSARSAATVSFEDASHKRNTALPPPLANVFPSGENVKACIHPSSRQRVRSSRPVPVSHSLIERSQLAVARVRPSGDKAMKETRA